MLDIDIDIDTYSRGQNGIFGRHKNLMQRRAWARRSGASGRKSKIFDSRQRDSESLRSAIGKEACLKKNDH